MTRDDLIDALRGFALFGILAVNIQSFVWGLGSATLGLAHLMQHFDIAASLEGLWRRCTNRTDSNDKTI